MAEEKHIIKKAIVEIHVPSAQDASDLQNQAMRFFKEKICPMIERIVEKHSRPGEIVRIDKLALDIKGFKPEEYSISRLQDLEEQIEKKIVALIAENKDNDFSGEIVTEVKRIPKETADEELFIYLLRTGALPWWAQTETAVSLVTIAEKVLSQPSDALKKELRALVAIPAARKRIIYQLPEKLTEKIILLVCSAPQNVLEYTAALTEVFEWYERKDPAPDLPKGYRQFIHEFVLRYPASAGSGKQLFMTGFLKERDELSFAAIIYRMSETVASDETVAKQELKQTATMLKQALADSNGYFSGKIAELFTEKDREVFFSDQKQEEKSDHEPEHKENDQQKQTLQNILKKKKDDPARIFPNADEESDTMGNPPETGDYFVKNSGIIIVAPYLSALFKELELCDGKKFVSDEARERAAYLLQYLATGSQEAEEHEMALNKILCGIDLQTPLMLRFSITDKEKEECAGLLQAVAANWTALKGTSGEGMRDAFFMRDGILEQQSNGWNLKIERTTIDILLDKLPWGISILQMPWSTEMIFVTW